MKKKKWRKLNNTLKNNNKNKMKKNMMIINGVELHSKVI